MSTLGTDRETVPEADPDTHRRDHEMMLWWVPMESGSTDRAESRWS